MTTRSTLPRWGQVIAGGTLLAIAIAAGAAGLKINVFHGLELRPEAGILFGLADLTKIVLPIVCGLIGWTLQTRLVAIVCIATSVFCAVTAFNTAADRMLAGKHHGADQYAAAKANVSKLETRAANLDAQAAAEAQRGGCGSKCQYLGTRADQARQALTEARQNLKVARPVELTGNEKLTSRINSVLFLVLIEALVWMSVPAMQLLRQQKKAAKRTCRKTRQVGKPRRKTDREVAKLRKIATQAFVPPRMTKTGKPDRRYKVTRLTNDNTVNA